MPYWKRPFTLITAMLMVSVIVPAGANAQDRVILGVGGPAFPVQGSARFDQQGRIAIDCALDGQGHCAALTQTVGGTQPPTIAAFTPSATSLSAPGGLTLAWSSNGEACYAFEPEGIDGWTATSGSLSRALAASGTRSISGVPAGNYIFGLRCYSRTGSSVARTQQVVVAGPGGGPVSGDNYCDQYYSGTRTKPTTPEFTAYGFTRVDKQFEDIFNIPVGDVMGGFEVRWVPGMYVDSAAFHYVAIAFTMQEDAPANPRSQAFLRWFMTQVQGTFNGAVSVTVSPCAGDFRSPPSVEDVNDHYLSGKCRRPFGAGGSLVIDATSSASACFAPKGKRMYINVAAANMFQGPPAASSCTGVPRANNCGVSMRFD